MKDARFKELINLHLDHRLSAAEARELEQALQSDPERRRVFRGYALMQRGCAELFRRSALDAPAPDSLVRALREAETRMTERSQRRTAIWGWSTWGATAGVAAIVTLMVARVSQPGIVAGQPERGGDSAPSLLASDARTTPSTLGPGVRGGLPPHLTLAALGISPETDSSQSVARWHPSEDPARGDQHLASVPAWANVNGGTEWQPAGFVQAQFAGRPINAWSSTNAQGGAQFQSASFSFER